MFFLPMTKPAAVKNILKIRFVITRGYFCDLNVRKIFFEKFSAAAKFGFFSNIFKFRIGLLRSDREKRKLIEKYPFIL